MYILDKSNLVTKKVSNDTFFYLQFDEEPILGLDEDEVNSIFAEFQNGFEILSYEQSENGFFTCQFATYIEHVTDYDMHYELTSVSQLLAKRLDNGMLAVCFMSSKNGIVYEHTTKIEHTAAGSEYFISKLGSMFFLSRFKPLR